MFKFLLTLFFPIFLFASVIDSDSFSANFKQTVTNEFGKKITYHGNFSARKPYFAVWNYKKPVLKSIYISSNQIVILEPELEQATYTQLEQALDFFEIIKHAKRVSSNQYKANINNMLIDIYLKNGVVTDIKYKDKLENFIEITFNKQNQQTITNMDIFIPKIPTDYDIIR
jgi:outer membrane lipoprotein carrier protein